MSRQGGTVELLERSDDLELLWAILRKFGVRTRVQAAADVARLGLVTQHA